MNIAIVTGASSGMGRYFSVMLPHFFTDLDEIWIIARRRSRLLKLKEKISIPVKVIPGDLLDNLTYEELSNNLKESKCTVKVLVNCAGYGKSGDFKDISLDDNKVQSEMVQLNCTSLTRMTEVCIPYLSSGSRIINLASSAAFCPQPHFAVYAASKAYVLSFSRALGHEIKGKGIYVTSVCPGPVDTEFFNVSGGVSLGVKKLFMAKPEKVVSKAIKDSIKKKELSIYGAPMKISHIASKILPVRLMMKLF